MTEAWQEVLVRTLKIAGLGVLWILPLALWVAYRLAKQKKAHWLLEQLVLLPVVLPPVVTGYLLLWIFSPKRALGAWLQSTFHLQIPFTWWGAACAAALVAFPLLVQPIRAAFSQIDPHWVEAVRIDGGSHWAIFRWIYLPLSFPTILASLGLAFARAVGEFGATVMVAGNIAGETQTLALAIYASLNRLNGDAETFFLVLLCVGLSGLSLVFHALCLKLFKFQ